jgi:hypothetical protein
MSITQDGNKEIVATMDDDHQVDFEDEDPLDDLVALDDQVVDEELVIKEAD